MRTSVVAVTILLASCAGPASNLTTGAPAIAYSPKRQPVAITEADRRVIEAGLRATLKDPESARVDSLVAGRSPKGHVFVCGRLNAKNSFGGYVGFMPFAGELVTAPPGFTLHYVAKDAVDAALVRSICGELASKVPGLA